MISYVLNDDPLKMLNNGPNSLINVIVWGQVTVTLRTNDFLYSFISPKMARLNSP